MMEESLGGEEEESEQKKKDLPKHPEDTAGWRCSLPSHYARGFGRTCGDVIGVERCNGPPSSPPSTTNGRCEELALSQMITTNIALAEKEK